MRLFIESLEIPATARAELLELTPWAYTGMAAKLARRI
jgi:adenylosuccinate lyase